jgi:hypothetical protein
MSIFYSPSNEGFYDTSVIKYPSLPRDCIEITREEHSLFLHEMNANNKKLVRKDDVLVLEDRPEIITWEMIRNTRNRLLNDSDYTQVPDFPGDKDAWAAYRQELREVTNTFSSPELVEWPVKPNN